MNTERVDYKLKDRLNRKILILDGAMGTMIQRYDLDDKAFRGGKGNNDILNLTSPEIIEDIHRQYISAGADIITTNTFSGNAISQAEYGCEKMVYDINRKGVEIAKRAVLNADSGREILIAGSIGPTIRMLSFSPDVTRPEYRAVDFDTMVSAYREQAEGLLDGGVDIIIIETVIDGLNAKAALYAIHQEFLSRGEEIPVILSATINDKSGRLLNGQQPEALYAAVRHFNLAAFGLNCSFGAKELLPFIEQISEEMFLGKGVGCATIFYPNAGLPNEMGQYDETPEYMAECIRKIAQKGFVNIVGGCCGTTPDHIRAIKEAVEGLSPRPLHSPDKELWVAGLDALLIDKERKNFVNVGERTNVAGSAKFAKLIREGAYSQASAIARGQIEGGATIIDINMDDAMLDSPAEMAKFIRYISNDPDIAKVPFMIDSSNWETILAGLKNSAGKCIVNSLSLKEGEEEFLKKAKEVHNLGAALIVMAFDEKGQAVTFERKTEICARAYKLLTQKAGYAPCDIIFDVNILSIATGIEEHENYAIDYIRAVEWIKKNLPGCKTSGGVSNLSFAFRGNNRVREAMHSVFLYYAIQAGLDMAIVNPTMLQIYSQIEPKLLNRVEAVVLNNKSLLKEEAEKYATPTDALIEIAQEIKAEEIALKEGRESLNTTSAARKGAEWRNGSLQERISHALIKGISDFIQADMKEALGEYSPIEIIQGPLMNAMDNIGNLFGEGKMFLPQVVKSAKVMRDAVDFLTPYIKESTGNGENTSLGTIVLATAKGDVHDIGKNIVSIVLSCNNFNVIDLGVMVSNETILEEAIRSKADIVGISGLITPSLEQMENLCKLFESEKERIVKEIGHPVTICVGGATTSSVHTAVKLAPLYSYCTAYSIDASKAVGLCKRIMTEKNFREEIEAEQQKIRDAYYSKKRERLPIETARESALPFPLESFIQKADYGENNICADISVGDLFAYIDWTMFFNFWGFKGKYPNILYSGSESEKVEELFNNASDLLAEVAIDGSIEVKCVVNFYDAFSKEEEVFILENGPQEAEKKDGLHLQQGRKPIVSFRFPRQQQKGSGYRCIADYFPEAPYTSKAGFIVIKAEDTKAGKLGHKEFDYLLRQSLCARLAEAAAIYITEKVSMGEHIIRAAIGYPISPDHSFKREIFNLTQAERKIGVSLTPSYAIKPATSVCAILIAHKEAEYFDI